LYEAIKVIKLVQKNEASKVMLVLFLFCFMFVY